MTALRAPFKIAGEHVPAGTRSNLTLPVPGQSAYTPMSMPLHVVHGRREGPVVFLSAAIHGDEINGIEIIRQILRLRGLARLSGTLICVPIVNVYGFQNHTRYLPDRRDLNRSFPGAHHGSLAARMARVFAEEIVDKATLGIDLHTGANNRTNLPHIRADLDDPETRKLAAAFGTPIAINANLRDGSLRQYALEKGMPMLLYEAGEALRFNKLAIRTGVRGVTNVLREIGMLPASRGRKDRTTPVTEARMSRWIRAPQSGLLRAGVDLGVRIERGETLGHIADALGDNEADIESPFTGIVIGRTNLPIVNEGDALFHVAAFHDSVRVEGAIETQLEGLTSGDYV